MNIQNYDLYKLFETYPNFIYFITNYHTKPKSHSNYSFFSIQNIRISQKINYIQLLASLLNIIKSHQYRGQILLYFNMFNSSKPNLHIYAQHLKPYCFQVKKVLGSGAFAQVILAVQNGQDYAIKCIKKKLVNDKPELITYIRNEFQIMKVLQHPNIIKQFGIIQDDQFYFILLEYCNLGNLLNYQSNLPQRRFSVKQTREIISKLIQAIGTIHNQGYIHRDIKPQNILLKKDRGKLSFKIGDFGFARPIQNNAQTYCGTTNFMAPQILADKPYTISVDCWSLGVLMYFMIFGQLPFKGIDILVDIKKKCKNGFELKNSLAIDIPIQSAYEQLLQNFYEKLFVLDPTKRIGINQMMQHPLFFNLFHDQKQRKIGKLPSRKSTEDTAIQEQLFPYKLQKKEVDFQIQKLYFIKGSILVFGDKNDGNLVEWEKNSVKYYLIKAFIFYSQQLIHNLTSFVIPQNNENIEPKKWKQFCNTQYANQYLKILKQNISSTLPQLKQSYNELKSCLSTLPIKQIASSLTQQVQQKSFEEFKTSYRAAIGNAFKNVHEKKGSNNGRITQLQLKMELFCCHLINRVFQHRNIVSNLGFYFDWKKKYHPEDVNSFESLTFRKWLNCQSKQNLDKNINILYQKYMSAK